MKREILGVGFDSLTLPQAAEAVEALLRAGSGGSVVTANAEILLRAQGDPAYTAAINGASLVFPDGVGVLRAAEILGRPLPERVAGADLVPLVLEGMARREESLFLYGGKPAVASRAAEALEARYPGLRIVGTENGYIPDESALLRRLESLRPALLLLGLGAPRQEFWMRAHRDEFSCVMIGVGGLLDVFAGDLPRAPESWQRAGLEWLYRLLREPRRITRVAPLPRLLLLARAERRREKKRGQNAP